MRLATLERTEARPLSAAITGRVTGQTGRHNADQQSAPDRRQAIRIERGDIIAMKKHLRLAGIVAGVAIIAAACGPSGGTTAPSTGASSAPSSAGESTAPESQAPAALEGEVTLWHSYGSGGGEGGALNTVLETVRAANPGLTINVVEQPFDQIFTKWRTDVAAGEGADMFIAPNDDLGKDAREESILNLDPYLVGNAALEGYLPVALDGSKVDGSFYMVPESLKAVALWYDKQRARDPADDLRRAPRRCQGRLDQARHQPGRLPPVRLDRRLRWHPHG